tara:strand:+ start:1764 stop:2495 length:732 start_codon:yes stop_codon:yes gene_type:complete
MYTLENHGFQKFKVPKKNFDHLINFKNLVEKTSNSILKKKEKLNNIHNHNFDKIDFNSFRLKIFNKINKKKNIHEIIFGIYDELIISLIGKDICVQKNINFSIQRPFDQQRAPFHKDSPPNSPYEIVVWLPLVDCFKDMSMYLFDIKKSKKIDQFLSKPSNKSHDIYAKKNGVCCECKFGELLIFSAPTYHYIPVNSQKDSRWSINCRYKNTFSPNGMKGYLDFFEPLRFSDITKLAIKYEKK